MKEIESRNPYNNQLVASYSYDNPSSIANKLKMASNAEKKWGAYPIDKRSQLLSKVADLLIERKKLYAELMTQEMGKPIVQSITEIEKCAWACDFYAKNAEDFLADDIIKTDATESFISYDPLGCILAIMPWNYPFWQVIRFAAPTLTAGNVGLLKHAANVTGCGLAIQQLFEDAGYPKGCFQALIVEHEEIEDIIANNIIKAVTLTGSEKAGKSVSKIAGFHLKKTVLELGGNNACIVWEDADLDKYLDTMVNARMQNTGQSCIAAKRFIVCEEIYDTFLNKFKEKVKQLVSGNPMNRDTYIGVMAREDLAKTLQDQVDRSIKKGAEVLLGNQRNGAYFSPTILVNVTPGMAVFDEETFGPVAAVISAKNRTHSIELAAKSRFGLGSMLFTEDIDAAFEVINEIPDGAFFINDMVKSDPRLPFGGTKASGYGRELSKEGILEFVNKKTVYIAK